MHAFTAAIDWYRVVKVVGAIVQPHDAFALQGPSGWEDVLTPRKLNGQCHRQGCNGTFAVSCREIRHVHVHVAVCNNDPSLSPCLCVCVCVSLSLCDIRNSTSSVLIIELKKMKNVLHCI